MNIARPVTHWRGSTRLLGVCSVEVAPALAFILVLGSAFGCGDEKPDGNNDECPCGCGDASCDGSADPNNSNSNNNNNNNNDGGTEHGSKWLGAYYVGYQRSLYSPDSIDFSAMTNLFVGRVVPRADGTLNTTFDIDSTNGPALARELVERTKAAGKKAFVMLGGAGTHEGWVGAASDANRSAFVSNLLQMVDDYGFEGMDIDWEPIYESDQPNLKKLLQELRQARPELVLTLPVGWTNSNYEVVPPFFAEIASSLDQINLMTYSMAGSWYGWLSWHSSALTGERSQTPSSVMSSVDAYLEAGVPAEKIGVGIGFYGSCWGGVDGPGQELDAGAYIAAGDNDMSYRNIITDYYTEQSAHWDDTAKVPYLSFAQPTGPHDCAFVSYEDERSIREKAAYVVKRGLGGAIIWTVNQGHLPGNPSGQRDPLLRAAASALGLEP